MNLSKATALLLFSLSSHSCGATDDTTSRVLTNSKTNLRQGQGQRITKLVDNIDVDAESVDIIVELNDDDDHDGLGDSDLSTADASESWTPPGQVIAAEKRSKAAAFAKNKGLSAGHTYGATMYGFSATSVSADEMERLMEDPAVKSVEIDGVITLDPREGEDGLAGRRLVPDWKDDADEGGGVAASQTTPWGITRVGADGNGPVTGKRACVLDTGIDLTNPDLNVASDCFNAFTKGKDGDSCQDRDGHGTHVAGTIAAIDNGIDVVGVAPGATVVAIKVLDGSGSGSWSGIIAGMEWAASNNCDVANMSLGGGVSNSVNNAAVNLGRAGVKVVLAAGNEDADASGSSPASAEGINIYTVSASDSGDRMASFSNYGSGVDVAAPGVSVSSLRVGGGTVSYSGTSMAAPHVAGLLLLDDDLCFDGRTVSNDPDGDPDQIAIMCSSGPPPTTTTTRATASTTGGTTTSRATTTVQATTTRQATTVAPTCGGWRARCDSDSPCCDRYRCNWKGRCKN